MPTIKYLWIRKKTLEIINENNKINKEYIKKKKKKKHLKHWLPTIIFMNKKTHYIRN